MFGFEDASQIDLQPLRTAGLQIVRGFFSGEAREALVRRGQEVIDGVASGDIQRSGQFALGLEQAWFEPVFGDPKLLDLVAQALGPDLCISTWRVLMKDHHFQGAINVHQDWPYFGGDTRKLNVFIPLTPVGEENGGLVFYERSHLYGPLDRGNIDVQRYGEGLTQVCPELEVGDVLLADFLTWHYSAPSRAAKDRIMFQLVYQPADDPSSAHLLRGQRRNPFFAQHRDSCLSEPLTLMNVPAARAFAQSGDPDRAERFARGMLASDDTHAGAALLLADLLRQKGDKAGAEAALDQARRGLESLRASLREDGASNAALNEAQARADRLERELSALKSSRSWRWTAALRRRP